jgi:hypothetical protein
MPQQRALVRLAVRVPLRSAPNTHVEADLRARQWSRRFTQVPQRVRRVRVRIIDSNDDDVSVRLSPETTSQNARHAGSRREGRASIRLEQEYAERPLWCGAMSSGAYEMCCTAVGAYADEPRDFTSHLALRRPRASNDSPSIERTTADRAKRPRRSGTGVIDMP